MQIMTYIILVYGKKSKAPGAVLPAARRRLAQEARCHRRWPRGERASRVTRLEGSGLYLLYNTVYCTRILQCAQCTAQTWHCSVVELR